MRIEKVNILQFIKNIDSQTVTFYLFIYFKILIYKQQKVSKQTNPRQEKVI